MQDDFGVGDSREEAADREEIAAHDGPFAAYDTTEIEAVGLEEGATEEWGRDIQPDVL